MGLLDFFLGKDIKIEDPFFGKMLFLDFKDASKDYFECRRHFKPSNNQIEIGIEGDAVGPTEVQKDFFRSIETNYDAIIASIKPMIENEFKNWKEDFKIENFKDEFMPVYLFLPRCIKEPKVWEIAFETQHDLNHYISITMNDFNAKEIVVDG